MTFFISSATNQPLRLHDSSPRGKCVSSENEKHGALASNVACSRVALKARGCGICRLDAVFKRGLHQRLVIPAARSRPKLLLGDIGVLNLQQNGIDNPIKLVRLSDKILKVEVCLWRTPEVSQLAVKSLYSRTALGLLDLQVLNRLPELRGFGQGELLQHLNSLLHDGYDFKTSTNSRVESGVNDARLLSS